MVGEMWLGVVMLPALRVALVERSSTNFFILDARIRATSSPQKPFALSFSLALQSREVCKTGGSIGKVHFLHVASSND